MKIKINALDTLTFGVGKPSVWGEDTFGAGMFPPFPSVIRGAVRASWLYENGSVELADTDDDPTKSYAITEYAVLFNGEPHFSVPADYLLDNETKKLVPCELKDNDGLSSLTTPCQLWVNADGKVSSADRQYISREELQNYLNGETLVHSVQLSDYITDESKIGIFIERGSGTAKKSMLYRSPLTRLANAEKNASLAVNISGADKIPGLTRFGGENKVANFTAYCGDISPSLVDGAIGEDGRFKLYIASPAIFESGCLPELPVPAELLTAAVYGYDNAGGFDMKRNQPKPMRRAVRAGSVYYYKLKNPDNREKILALHGTSISGDYTRKDGFGICYIGKI
jgi:CRISPR-associated protein Cmr3